MSNVTDINNGLVFREDFKDEFSVRKNGGTPTNVIFEDDKGVFSGNGKIQFSPDKNFSDSNITIRLKFNINISDSNQGLLIKSNGGTPSDINYGFYLYITSNNKISLVMRGSNDITHSITSDDTIIIDTLYEVIVAYNIQANTTKLFLNGVEKTTTLLNTINLVGNVENNLNLTIGSESDGGNYFNGSISLVEIYNRALSTEEVYNLYNNTQVPDGGYSGELVVNGRFDDDSNWELTPGWIIENGVATFSGLVNNDIRIFDLLTLGNTYSLRYSVTENNNFDGYLKLSAVTATSQEIIPSTVGQHTIELFHDGTLEGYFAIRAIAGTAGSISIDNISVKEIYHKKLFDLTSQNGYIEDKSDEVVPDELVTNGGFDTDSDWIKTGTWEISNGTAKITNGNYDLLYQNGAVLNRTYDFTFNVISISGVVRPIAGSSYTTENITTIGYKHVRITCNDVVNIRLGFALIGIASVELDNISIKEVKQLSPSNVELKKLGHIYNMQYNGSDSYIDTGSDFIGTKTITVCGWINPRSFGESGGRIIDNGRLTVFSSSNLLVCTSDYTTQKYSASNSIILNKYQFVSVTRTETGIVNFYIGDLDNTPSLSGTAGQNSGTPTAGTYNVFIGNNNATSRTFDGTIGPLTIFEGILTLNEITKYWSDTKKLLR